MGGTAGMDSLFTPDGDIWLQKLNASSPFTQRNEAPNFHGHVIRKLVKFTKELRLIVAITVELQESVKSVINNYSIKRQWRPQAGVE